MTIVLRAIFILFGIIDVIALVWFADTYTSLQILARCLLILSEFYFGFSLSSGKAVLVSTNICYVFSIIGIGMTLIIMYESTTYSFGVDWAAILIRVILLSVFMKVWGLCKLKNATEKERVKGSEPF